MREHGPSEKIVLVGRGDLRRPATCIVCGSGTRQEGYVDIKTYIDYHGQVYLCRFCIEQAAEVVGCLTYAESQHVQEMNTKLATENDSMRKELEDANTRLAAFDNAIAGAIASVGTSPLPNDSSGVSTDASVKEPKAKHDKPASGSKGAAGRKSTVKVAVTKPGPSDATGDGSDDDSGKVSL